MNALRRLHGLGQHRMRGGPVAKLLRPSARSRNASGQVFHLGAAGRMPKTCKAVGEISPGEYEIRSYRLGN